MIPSCPQCGKPLTAQHTHDDPTQMQTAATFYNPDPDDPDPDNAR